MFKKQEDVVENMLELYDVKGEGNRIIVIENGIERDIVCSEKIPGIEIVIHGNNNEVRVEYPINASNSKILVLNDNAYVHIGSTYLFQEVYIWCTDGGGQRVDIGTGVTMHGDGIVASEDADIRIGDGCMFAGRVYIYGADGHAIFDVNTGECINGRKYPVVIGAGCWIGSDVRILKNAVVPNNSIVASATVVTKDFSHEGGNVCLAGNPAKVVKRGVDWSHESPSERGRRLVSDEKNLMLSSNKLIWRIGQRGKFAVHLNECKLANLQVQWKSLNPEICEISSCGEIVGTGKGITKIVATYAGAEAVCEVEVIE